MYAPFGDEQKKKRRPINKKTMKLRALPLLLSLFPAALVHAVFQDEVGHIDYRHELLGIPQRDTTLFHRPRRQDKASLLYTLSDVGVLGAVNPATGVVIWRQLLELGDNGTLINGGGFLRAGEGEGLLVTALGSQVQSWEAVGGRNAWSVNLDGTVRDLEVMELTEKDRKDVLVLSEGVDVAVRRLDGNDGRVVWEWRETTSAVPVQVSTDAEKVFVVSLKGTPGGYNLRVAVLDTPTGRRLDDFVIGTKSDVHAIDDVMFVGANSAAPIVAWTDAPRQKLFVNVLGSKNRQEFPLPSSTLSVEIHAPHLVQSEPHFLVHSRTAEGGSATVYHTNIKTGVISKAYDLPFLAGPGAFSTSSIGANVYFTRVTKETVTLVSSASNGVLGQWSLSSGSHPAPEPIYAVADVIHKAGSGNDYAVRAAIVSATDAWTLIQNGKMAWVRPEGLTGAVAATFAEFPENESLAKSLEQEAHSNPLEAYIHRVKRHFDDLRYLPAYLSVVPTRLLSSIMGTEVSAKDAKLSRDSFGFHKLVIVATRRGMVYGLDIGDKGEVVWSKRVFEMTKGNTWNVAAIHADETKGHVTIIGSNGDRVVLDTAGEVIDIVAPGPERTVQGAALVDTVSGPQLLPVGVNGHIGELASSQAPKQTVVTRGPNGELRGLLFVPNGPSASETMSWVFSPPAGQRVVSIATRPAHDPIASIGRVLGDRTVKYKYLNPNTAVIAAIDDKAPTLTVYLVDTISGEILTTSKHDGVDTSKSIECAMAENWFICSFFGEYALKDSSTQSLKGYQVVVSDLYESDAPNDRGPLGNEPQFSSLDPVENPAGTSPPSVVSQTFILSAPISALQVTQTRQGISSRNILAYLPESHGIVSLPRMILEPRRPVGRDPTPAEMEEGLLKYHPAIEIDPKSVISHQWDVLGVQKIITSPAIVESTSLVFAYGIDVFGTRVAPSFLFDILGKGFNKVSLIGTVLAITAGVMVLRPMVSYPFSEMKAT